MEQVVSKSIPCPIRRAATVAPDRPALTDGKRSLTYGQLDNAVNAVELFLKKMGIGVGNVVAALDWNSISYAILFYAAFRRGCILMPLNCRRNESDWRTQLNHAKCGILVYGDQFGQFSNLHDNSIRIDSITGEKGERTRDAADKYELDREALIIFSSGSSGHPRGAVLTWSNLYYSAVGLESVIPLYEEDCWMAMLPFFHIGGISILFRTALAGCSALVIKKFDPAMIMGMLRKTPENKKQTLYLSVVPTMLNDLIKSDNSSQLRKLKAIILGGATLDEQLKREIMRRELPILTTYGMTETGSMVTLLPVGDSPDKLETAGKVLPHRSVMIADMEQPDRFESHPLPRGREGRILVRGETVFSHYIAGESKLKPGCWFDTGDIGHLDDDGYLTVLGRADNIIVSGGENIDLSRIERAISTLQGVNGVVVLARPDMKWGSRPIAFIETDDDGLTESSIRQTVTQLLPRFMIPDSIILTNSLPVTGVGKYDRVAIRKRYRDCFQEVD